MVIWIGYVVAFVLLTFISRYLVRRLRLFHRGMTRIDYIKTEVPKDE